MKSIKEQTKLIKDIYEEFVAQNLYADTKLIKSVHNWVNKWHMSNHIAEQRAQQTTYSTDEPATEKQIAWLEKNDIKFNKDITKKDASKLIDTAIKASKGE